MNRRLIWLATRRSSPFNKQVHEQLVACANGERYQVSKGEHETQWHSKDDPVKYDELDDVLIACQRRSDKKSLELDPSESRWLSQRQIDADLDLMEAQWSPVSRSNAILCDGGTWAYSCEEFDWVGERVNDLVDSVCEEDRDFTRDRVRQILLASRFRIELDESWCSSAEELEKHVAAFEQRWSSRDVEEYDALSEDKSKLYDLASPVDLPRVMERVGAVIRNMFLR